MKTIIAGSRIVTDYEIVKLAVEKSHINITTVISGGAKGVDSLAIKYAGESGLGLVVMPAEWNRYGKSAGFKRNEEMAKFGEALIAIWDGKSRGTEHMIFKARMAGLRVYVYRVNA
jgi:predicted Rossmann fold nucleotide-binding protein DprA/Smf involved in DNA uptake